MVGRDTVKGFTASPLFTLLTVENPCEQTFFYTFQDRKTKKRRI